ncbi:MAG: Response regulator receiver protein [Parcubacteria group bacterium GW2011_GWA2_45_14]|nr:MAG: Response regulator receiver protein [Parcubacteria group bacterium GW2011_GWA2_45_14]
MIDDDPMLLKLYEMTARTHEEITFLTAINTVEGDKIAREQKPDVILLDLILGKEPNTPVTEVDKNHGFNFLIMLKGDPEIRDIPVIIFSNLDTKQDHDRARDLQAADYIVKAKTTPEDVFTVAKGVIDIAGAEKKIRDLQEKSSQ